MKTVELKSEFESESMSTHEQLSALHDGQLSAEMAAALVRQSLQDESLMQEWRSMSAISHVLREQQHGALLPNTMQREGSQPAVYAKTEAANDGVFRWKMVAGLAAFAAVGSLAWGLLGSVGSTSASPSGVMAQSTNAPAQAATVQALLPSNTRSQVTVAGQEVTMIRDPRLDEFLAAHKQFGGISALQQPAGSLRSVSLGNVSASNERP